MYRKTLIPLDGSPLSERVLASTLRLLEPQEAGVTTLLRIVDEESEREAAHAALAEVRERVLSPGGLPASLQVEVGDPAERILALANTGDFDLIAMTTHGRTGALRLVRGSVAERVLRSTSTPLLLCSTHDPSPAGQAPFERVLVPHDGSSEVDALIPHLLEFKRLYGTQVVLLRVASMAAPSALGGDLRMQERADVLALLAPIATRWREAGLEVETRAAFGEPAAQILAVARAETANLLALTTHGRSGAERWWFGSVSEAVLREAHTPLLLLRNTKGK